MNHNFNGEPLNACHHPYDDDYMTFDKITGHYVLTEKAIVDKCGVDIRARLLDTSTVNPETLISVLVTTVSDMVYEYIHQFSIYNDYQDKIIATIPSMRNIILRAMAYQAHHVMFVGNLYNSTDLNEQKTAINQLCKDILSKTIPELGRSILYGGV